MRRPRPRELRAFFSCLAWRAIPSPLSKLKRRLDTLALHGILQARMLEWIAVLTFRGSSQPRDQTCISCIAERFFTIAAAAKSLGNLKRILLSYIVTF